MKKLLPVPILAVLILAGVLVWFFMSLGPVSSSDKFGNFVVNSGESAGRIGTNLEKAGYVKNALAFKVYVQFLGLSSKIQAGQYRLTPSFSLLKLVDQLVRGPEEAWVTIPEGLRREEIAVKIADSLNQDQTFVSDFMTDSQGKEGMLFPDTYLLPKDSSPSAVVAKMFGTFQAKTGNLIATGSSLSFNQLITLASLIERETKTEAERPVVAGILIKRLNAGWPLQIDATVQYAIASENCKLKIVNCMWWQPLGSADLSIDSPYNTYKFTGLPPAPISNPGLSSIKAAFNPVSSDFWYYIHDGEGQIHYARTLEEQSANIKKYLQ